MATHLTKDMSTDVMECTRSAMLLTFTDEQLENEYFDKKYMYSRHKRHQESPYYLNRFDPSPEVRAFREVHHRLEELIQNYCDDGRTPFYLDRIKTLAAAFDRAKIKYGDPSMDGYQAAMDSGVETIMNIQSVLRYGSQDTKTEYPLTSAQENVLTAVMFLLRQSGVDDFYPALSPEDTSMDRWLMDRILASPEDAESHVAAYRERMARWREVEAKLQGNHFEMRDHDALCDYPDELIDRLAQLMHDDYRLWDDLGRYAITVNGMNSEQTVNELLCFMKPCTGYLNVRYLSSAIPSLLRAYKFLPPMDDYSKAPEPLRAQCAALLLVSMVISKNFYGDALAPFLNDDRTIRDQRLIDLLMAHPERSEEIAAVIEERRIADFESLVQVSSGTLSSGAL